MLRLVPLLIAFLTVSCTAPNGGSGVTRAECLAIAEAYRSHKWQPTEANVLHGADTDGIQVDTPDICYRKKGSFPGWWVPGRVNEGMPYQWGGFATPEQFDLDIAAGKAAGDVYTQEKRRLLDAAVSRHATGIDCSGFISRCWKLPRSYSTRELERLCTLVSSWQDLLPGDILNTWNSHALLFAGWLDESHSRIIAYETGSPPDWLVVRHSITVDMLVKQGYVPLRYQGMRGE
ncbi:MAG TPA: hypothetical protein VG796_26395 [Verrucomicrobiales bacterium]|nr:hypothetical protein [Verrucomicrobiales bacterium]